MKNNCQSKCQETQHLLGDELRSTNVRPATGFETQNMFYVNNGSGIRNMTLQGLIMVRWETLMSMAQEDQQQALS